MTRTLQNVRLFFGVLRLRGHLEPVRTRSLVISNLPRAIASLLNSSKLGRVLFLIGDEQLARAKNLIETADLSPKQKTLANGAYLIAIGELSAAIRALEPDLNSARPQARGIRKRLIVAASSELTYLQLVANAPKPKVTPTQTTATLAPVAMAIAHGTHSKGSLKWLTDNWSVLHVLGTSLPNTHAGYTMRTQFLIRAIANQGVTNAGVTRYLYPVDRAVLRSRNIDQVDSVTYIRELPTRSPNSRQSFHDGWANYLTEVARATKARLLQPTTDFPNGRAALVAAAELNLPVVYEVRGFLEESAQARKLVEGVTSFDLSERYELSRQAETTTMREATAITTLSETMKREIADRGVDAQSIHVMPNGVPAELLTTRTDVKKLKSQLQIGQADFVVGVVTTFSAHEGLPTLIDAISILKARKLPVKCVMVGGGPTWRATKQLISEKSLSDSIYLPGRVKPAEVAQWYQILDLFVLPRVDSRVTQLVTPLKPLEAMALGVPVAASDVAGIREVVIEGETGALFTPDDPLECANKIEELLYDSATRDALSGAGRAWVSQQRTWAMIAKRYVSLYQELGAI